MPRAVVWCETTRFLFSAASWMKKTTMKKAGRLSRRLSFPQDEQRIPWLPLLLDAYAIADTGIQIAVRKEEKQRNVRLACGKGCGNCCVHQTDIPLYPHELVGIYWYVTEKLDLSVRNDLKIRLAGHHRGSACPFVVDGSCCIHPLRPVGCRQFNVFTTPCAPDEDPYFTRREDVLTPIAEYTDRAFAAVLPFYNIKREGDLAAAIRLVRSQIMNLQAFDWNKLVAVIEKRESLSME